MYFNCAATSAVRPPCVEEAVVSAMRRFGNTARGISAAEIDPARTIFRARRELADLFGFSYPSRVVFCANATAALNTAISGILHSGDHCIATVWDHNSVLRPLYALQKQGVEVSFVQADKRGRLDMRIFTDLIRSNTKMIICTHTSNVTGNVLDIGQIGRIAVENGIILLVDAAQAAGERAIDMEESGISVLCFTGHKSLMGPTGTGGMCVAPSVDIVPLLRGGTGMLSFEEDQPEEYPAHLEAGTLNSHGIAGLLAAAEFIRQTGVADIHAKLSELTGAFLRGIRDIDALEVYGEAGEWLDAYRRGVSEQDDPFPDCAPVVSLNLKGIRADEVGIVLAGEYDMAVRTGIHCAPLMHKALGTDKDGTVRFSFGYFNTVEEIREAADALRKIAGCSTWS